MAEKYKYQGRGVIMNCPNCDKRPVGWFHSLRSSGVNWKNKFQGYFKCRHCDTILRQKKSSVIFPEFTQHFWIYYLLYLAFVLALGYGVLYLLIWVEFQPVATIAFLALFGVIALGSADELRARHWILVEADPEEDAQTAEKLSTMGVIIFVAYAIISGGLAVWGIQQIDISQLSNLVFLLGSGLYFIAVFGGAMVILNKFSIQPEETLSD